MNDPANYRALSLPFASPAEANDALEAFLEDVSLARQKHRIRDVLTIASLSVSYQTGEGDAITLRHVGDTLRAVSMAAYAYGVELAQSRETLNRLMANTATTKKPL